ncbi:hypothetical protein M9608_24040 [Salmonella sp. NW988]
MAKM